MLLKYNNHKVVKTQPLKVGVLQRDWLFKLQTQGCKKIQGKRCFK